MGRDLDRENDKLRIAHGETGGRANYKWEFSENLYFPMRKEPLEYEYKANEKGIIEAKAVYEMRLQAPYLRRQWVLCRYMEPPTETAWKNTFGTKVAYPAKGYYAATNANLDEGLSPWDMSPDGTTFTDAVIRIAKKDRAKTIREWDDEGEAIVARREKLVDEQRDGKIDEEVYIPFVDNSPHLPGKRGGSVSFGGV